MNKFKSLLLLLITISSTSFGQKDTLKDVELGDVVVSAPYMAWYRTPVTKLNLFPSDFGPINIGQEPSFILSETPSMTVYSDAGSYQGYSYFRMRGIDQTRLNLSLDGVPLNEPEDQGVYFSNYPDFFNSIDGLQIQRGVGTSKNGNASYAGSIMFISPRLTDSMKTTFGAGYGSFNSYRVFGEFNAGVKKNVGFYIRGSHLHSDGYKIRSANTSSSAFYSGGLIKPRYSLKLTGFVGNQRNQMAWLGVPQADIDIDPRTNANSAEDDNFTQTLNQLKFTKRIGSNGSFTACSYYNFLDGNYDFDLNNFLGISDTQDLYNYAFRSHFLGAFANYSYINPIKVTYHGGFHANTYQRRHIGSQETLGQFYVNTGFKNEISAFSKIEWYHFIKWDKGSKALPINLFVDLQYRYTDFNYLGVADFELMQWHFFNPKLGLLWDVNSSSKRALDVYYNIGRAGREPTRNDLFGGWDDLPADSTGQGILYITDPEYVLDQDLGIRYYSQKFRFDFNLYFMDFVNEIVLNGQFGPNGLALNDNVDQSIRTGAELTLTYAPKGALSLFRFVNNSSFNYSRIDQANTSFTPILTPPLIVNQDVVFSIGYFETALSVRYQSASFIDFANENSINGYVLLNWRASYEWKGFKLSVFLNNITNTRYYNNGYVDFDGTNKYFIQAPFNFYGLLTYSF